MHLDVTVCLPREAESVALIRGVIGDTLTKLGVTADCVADIRLALSEACTNVIDHAAAEDEYEVRLKVDGARCEISITNAGHTFDAASLAGEMPGTSSARGRGVAIMHALMDSVAFKSEPEAGTIVHLVKQVDLVDDGPLTRMQRHPD